MNNQLAQIQNRVFGRDSDSEEKLVETLYVIMKEFGYTLEEMKKMSIPTFKYLIHFLNKEAQANEKAMRKR